MAITKEMASSYIDLHGGEAKCNESLKRLLDHIKVEWCRNDEICYEYVMKWMALMIQTPWIKPSVAIVIKGKPGNGK
jgi:hypothetical protein